MVNNDWERFGEELRRTIQNAVDHQDFSRLNQTVTDTIGRAMNNVSRGLKNGGWYRDPMNQGPFPGGSANPKDNGFLQVNHMNSKARSQQLYLKASAPKIGGIFLTATGAFFLVVTIVLEIIFAMGTVLTGFDMAGGILLSGTGFFMAVFAVMMGIGITLLSQVSRFRKYVSCLGAKEYCDIKDLAMKSGRKAKSIVKDLKKMIRRGWFREGHLDVKETCFMSSHEAFHQYTMLMERMEQQRQEQAAEEERRKQEKEKAEARMKEEYSKLSPDVQKVIQAGDEYVAKIRKANDAIPGEVISAKISRMEMLVDRIFDRVEQNPESVNDIRRLMEYYLPMTMKLLDAYEELDKQPIQGDNILSSKTEIEKTLDTLNVAFEKLLDDLFQDTAWDVSSDISVLETMLAQEGLTKDDIKK